ncbi:MAG: PAS domain S-box protein [Gemmatimonas sp.]
MTIATEPANIANLADALNAIDYAESPAARVKAAADALASFGFDRVLLTLRDAALSPTLAVSAGALSHSVAQLKPLPGVVWRRRFPGLERFKVGDHLYWLDGSDSWVAREFFAVEAVERADDPMTWIDTDLLIGLVRGADGELLGIAQLTAPRDGQRPNESCYRDIGWLMRHLGARLAHDNLRAVALRRAERLQRLQEAGAALARSLDEHEIIHELARQAARATNADGVVIASPDLQEQTLTTRLRMYRGVERPVEVTPLGDGIMAEVARTGKPVRVGERIADRAREQAGTAFLSTNDVLGNDGPAASVMAVPLLMGIRLIGVVVVHAAAADAFTFEDEEVIATMASQAATAIANARRYAESERERRQTEALADVARAVGESLRRGEVLRLILRHSLALLGADGAVVALRNDQYMHIVAAVGEMEMLAGVHLPIETSLMGKVALTGERLVSNDYASDSFFNRLAHPLAHVRRTVIAPLATARGIIGTLAVSNREIPFSDEDGRVLQRLADHVAVAIVNAQLFEEVERATREWKVAFDSISHGMVVIDEAQRIRRCNLRALELCRAESFQSLLGRRFGEALLGSAAGARAVSLDTLIVTAIETGTMTRSTVADERGARMFEIAAAPHPDGGVVVTFDDVSSVHRLAERHRLVVETSSDAIVITTPDRRISMANPAAHALFQRGDELVGMRVSDLTSIDSIEDVSSSESTVFGGNQSRYECRIVRPDGEVRRVSVSSAPLIELGNVVGSVASLRDITEQHGHVVARARSEDQYERLVEAASDSIFTTDTAGRFTAVNRALELATGRAREELLGMSCMASVDPRDQGLAQEVLHNTMRGARQQAELRYLDDKGVSRVCVLISSPILEDGAVVGGLGVVREISADQVRRTRNPDPLNN